MPLQHVASIYLTDADPLSDTIGRHPVIDAEHGRLREIPLILMGFFRRITGHQGRLLGERKVRIATLISGGQLSITTQSSGDGDLRHQEHAWNADQEQGNV